VPLTVIWLVGCANAFNLIDGLDGLAAGIGLFAAATAFLSALLHGNFPLALVTAPLIGALLGFLPYNFSPASIFMGDCGSLSVGFLLGCFGIIWTQKSATVLGLTAPLVALAVPLLDTALAIARRFLRGHPLFVADRGHIHHRLLARGLTTRGVAYIMYAFAGALAGLSLLLSASAAHFGGLALVAFCVITWAAVHYLGYEEFEAARRVLSGGIFRQAMQSSLSIRQLERTLQEAASIEDCWSAVLQASRGFGFSQANLELSGRQFSARLLDDPGECWQARIPLNGSGHLDLDVPFRSAQPPIIHALARFLNSALAKKLGELGPRAEAQTGADLARLAAAIGASTNTVSPVSLQST
jgi:UDP-GlcNAc:undecaprenyl-phosphate/decaprenyl-phosphate GlcNAc-1-phosphate transferase